MRIAKCLAGGWLLTATLALAGPPPVENVDLSIRSLEGDLLSEVRSWSDSSIETSWLGWHVPMVAGDRLLCCGDGGRWRTGDRTCRLEGTHRHFVFSHDRGFTVPGTGDSLVILLRSANGHVDDLQVYSGSCPLDAGNRALTWLEEVDPAASAAFLADLISEPGLLEGAGDAGDGALMALALHASPVATQRLISVARSGSQADLRGEVLFWLALSGADRAPEVILEALEGDGDPDVREEAVFALSQLPDDQGVPLLLEIARDPARSRKVRQEAFFWFVQEGEDQALELIADILSR